VGFFVGVWMKGLLLILRGVMTNCGATLRYPSSGLSIRWLEYACGFRHGGLKPGAGLVLILRWLDGLRRCAAIHPPVICGGWNPPAASDMTISCLVRGWCWSCDGLTDCGATLRYPSSGLSGGGWNPLAASNMAASCLARDWCWVCDGLTDCGDAPLSILRISRRRLESACGFRHGGLMYGAGLVLGLRWLDGLRRCAAIHPPVLFMTGGGFVCDCLCVRVVQPVCGRP
jgi:hypothetical protein